MRRAWAACLLLPVLGTPACAAGALRLGLGVDAQQWREAAADGRRLVDEAGRLPRLTAAWHGESQRDDDAPWRFSLQGGISWGARDYRGVSSNGAALQTRADVHHRDLRAEVGRPLGEAAGWVWAWRAALQAGWWSRELRGVGPVQGYPEGYRLAWLAAGLSASSGAWTLAAELGAGPGGRNRLQLPDRDPTSLPLGRLHAWQASAARDLGEGWSAGLGLVAVDLAAGQARPVTLGGVPVQSARQPATQWRSWQLTLSRCVF